MRRIHWSISSLACLSLTGVPLLAQEWKPVSQHRARYESVDTQQTGSMLGRPITGRSKVDQAIEPASFGTDQQAGLPLPAPPMRPNQYEMLPNPKTVSSGYPQGAVQMLPAGRPVNAPMATAPMAVVPNGVVTYPSNGTVTYPMGEAIAPVPYGATSPVIINGQVVGSPVVGGTIVGDPSFTGGYPGMEMGGYSDRYFRQAIHGSPGIWYGNVDFMLFSLSKDEAPPLLITGPQTTQNINSPGVSVLYGGGPLSNESMYGGRVTMGVWFNRCQTWGMFGSFFTTGTKEDNFSASSPDGSRFLARPFFNVSPINDDGTPHTPAEDIERVSQIGLGGSISINRTSLLRGGELNFRFNLLNNVDPCRKIQWNIDSYCGVKYVGLDESLTITENLVALDNNPIEAIRGTRYFVQDSFSTRNNFIGGNIGFMSEVRLGRFFVETRSGLALGVNMQEVNINGATQISPPNLPPSPVAVGGLLAQQSNIGQHTNSQFGIIPEFGLKMGLQVTDHMRVYAGYDMMYWANVVRPGQQIDYTVNASQIPFFQQPAQGPARPAFNLQTSNLWISSFSAGIQWVF